jgi:hypothetical protein
MSLKTCRDCKEERPFNFFWSAGIKKGKKYYRRVCKICYNTTNHSYKHKVKSWFEGYKQKLECLKCGYSKKTHESFNVKALQFHHNDDNKEFAVSEGVCHGLSMKRIVKEIQKCQVLCARCHAEHHYEI